MKVGLLTSKSELTFAQYSFVSTALANVQMEVYLVQLDKKDYASNVNKERHKKTLASNKLGAFMLKCQAFFELQVLKRFMGPRKWYNKVSIDACGLRNIQAAAHQMYQGIKLTLENDTFKTIEQSKFDILVSLDGPMSVTNLSELSNKGLVYTSCDPYAEQEVSATGFWQVFKKEPTSGFYIGFTPVSTLRDSIAFVGHRGTKDLCWQYNYFFLQKECYHHLYKFLIKVGSGYPLQKVKVENLDSEPIIFPKWFQFITYNTRLLGTLIKKIRNQLTKTGDYWTVYYSKGSYDALDFNKVVKIENPKGRYFADPFIYHYNNRDIVFVEEYVIKERKAVIAALELYNDGLCHYIGEVIREPFHLSYPFVFEYGNDLYMIPESSRAKSIRLYKCVSFPLQWEYQYDLISDIVTADTTIVQRDGKYWLFTNPREQDSEHNSILDCYVSDSPISQDWTPHPNNPIYFNNGARNGGFLYKDKEGHMVFQTYGLNHYGKSLQIKRIKTLSDNQFDTELVKEFDASMMKGIEGIHHLVSDTRYTVFDTLKKQPLKN